METLQHFKKFLQIQDVETQILNDWARWCEQKSYSDTHYKTTQVGVVVTLTLNGNDLQNLLADAALFNYWLNIWQNCAKQFVADCKAMKPKPRKEEARALFNIALGDTYTFYSKELIKNARTKQVDPCKKNNS